MSRAQPSETAERDRSVANLRLERDAVVLYDRLAGIEKDPRRAAAFRAIASNERRHAEIWATRLREAGVNVPGEEPPRFRIRMILALARVLGTRAVSDLVKALEGDEEEIYEAQGDPDVAAIMQDEREHAEIWHRLDAGLPGVLEKPTNGTPGKPGLDASTAFEAGAPQDHTGRANGGVVAGTRREETWHRTGQTGTLRAAIFGISDGLVSNLALVMGIAGASADNHFIVLAGVAGLLAGSFSMAAGEFISMQSQRELFQRQIDLEREEIKIMPEAEEHELAGIYRGKGLSSSEAALVAHRLMQNPQMALDTKIREELGLDPRELGSPWGAAAYSCISFAIGAAIPLLPFLLGHGGSAIVAAAGLAMIGLFVVGVGVSLLTGRSAIFTGLRQVAIGGIAAGVTYAVGLFIGVRVS